MILILHQNPFTESEQPADIYCNTLIHREFMLHQVNQPEKQLYLCNFCRRYNCPNCRFCKLGIICSNSLDSLLKYRDQMMMLFQDKEL